MKLENNKLLQGVITVVGIVLYLLSRKTKEKSKLTFLMIPICMLGLISLSCGNKKQDKVDINKALDNAIEKVEDEADKLHDACDDTRKESQRKVEKVKHKVKRI
ncbi:MAG: hypothetical protein ACLSGQ_18570 [Parabacteroides distasonis]|jgi:hypothetical protein